MDGLIFPFLFFLAVSLAANFVFLFKIKKFEENLKECDISAKLLVRRDLELVSLNSELITTNQELDKMGKVLVRSDLELSEANARLLELDSLKSEFVSVAAHQLRTPITSIKWSLSYLLENTNKLSAKQRKFIGNSLEVSAYMIKLIDDLLDTARIEEGKFGLKFKQQSIMPIIKKVYPKFETIANAKGLKFSVSLPESFPCLINIDEEKIAIVLDNLLDNAVKYTPIGGAVTLTVSQEENMVKVEVQDSGIGIPQNQINKVFTKFFRGSNAVLVETSGTGLGLYVVKNIIDSHEGTIDIDSAEKKGTSVSLKFPIVAKTVTLNPSRIGCPSIPGTMKGVIISVRGVKDVKVNYEQRSLDVTFDSTETSEEEIIKKVGQEMGLGLRSGEAEAGGRASETCPM